MRITPIRTDPITPEDGNLLAVLDRYLPPLAERSVVAITSKVVAICEGRVVNVGSTAKRELIEQEADYFLPPTESKYGITLTIKDNLLVPTAGIDESNGDGRYVLWPSKPDVSANVIRAHLAERDDLHEIGVILTDSTTRPLLQGVTGVALSHSGFAAVHDYAGRPDIFGRPLAFTRANIRDGLAAAAVLVMGEADERTPFAVVEDLPFVTFQDHNPAEQERLALRISPEDDLYAPLLTSIHWQSGHRER